jgi:hypothetical protein
MSLGQRGVDETRATIISKSQIVVYSHAQLLLGAQIAFRGLNRGVAQQEFDLFEIPVVLAAQFGTGAPQIVRAEALTPILPAACLHHLANHPGAEALPDLPRFCD